MSFEKIPGNEKIKNQLRSYLRLNKIPNSMIFSGPAGCLKYEFARTFVKALNCLNLEDDSCDCCQNCLQIDTENFIDLISIKPDGQQYRKYQIDQLNDLARMMPSISKFRVFILQQAHQMNESAANAFLKTLEEPSLRNIFILLSENVAMIIPTIRSRCYHLRFTTLPYQILYQNFLLAKYNPQEARILALYQIYGENFSLLNFKQLVTLRKNAISFLNAIFSRQSLDDRLLELYDRSANREQFLEYFMALVQMIIFFLRDILIMKINGANSNTIINFDLSDDLLKIAKNVNISWVLSKISSLNQILEYCQKNMNLRRLMLQFITSLISLGAEDGTYFFS